MIAKRISSIAVLLPIVLLPFQWYANMNVNPDTFESLGINGAVVLMDDSLRIGMIFLFVILIQVLSVKCNLIIYSVFAKILFCIVLGLYPVTRSGNLFFITRFIYEFYSTGFYLTILMILISIGADIKFKETSRRK